MSPRNLRFIYDSLFRFAEANVKVVLPGNGNQSNVLALLKQNLIKKSMLLLVTLLIFTSVVCKAQSPQKINFQSIVRNTNGVIFSNKTLSFKISLLSGSITGTQVYSETHSSTTDAIGLVSLQIGSGTALSGAFATINWGNAAHFIKLEADFNGGNTYVTLGTQELMSVPYAMYASKTDTASLNLTNRFAAKAPINNPQFTGTVGGITKAMVDGLENVENTSDEDKPVSSATQTALNTKVNISDTMTMLANYKAAIDTKLNKSDFPSGDIANEILYWNGTKWVSLPPGTTGQVLIMSSTGLSWGCMITNTAAAPSSSPTLLVNTALPTPITIATTGATGIDTINSGLPAGVTASWSANVITISGSPTAVGTFNYTFSLTGGCGSVNATGTITVTCLTNTAAAPSSSPTLVVNTALTNITIATTGATGIDTINSGLPAGVTASWSANVITISGSPTAVGTFNYTFSLTGGCGSVNATGTITVTCLTNTAAAPSSSPTLLVNTTLTNITIATTGATGIVTTASGLPAGVTAVWSVNVITISGTPTAAGTFNYTISLTGGCGSVNATGTITVTPAAPPSACPTTTVEDRDGNEYNTVGIGTQCWMQENLKVTKYNNGDDIPDGTANTSGWGALTTGARTEYVASGVTGYVSTYGYLYNWYAATDSRKICPTDWHVPTDTEWTTLENYLNAVAPTGSVGGKLKSTGTTYWNSPNFGATNSSDFSALPGGFRELDGSFYVIRDYAYFWSATEYVNNSLAWFRIMETSFSDVLTDIKVKSVGFSVRCLRD